MNINGLTVAEILNQVAIDIEDQKDYLCFLDGEVGDGDHGVSMTIGMRAVRRSLADLPTSYLPSDVFDSAAEAYAVEVGATIGPLYEAAFAAAGDAARDKKTLDHTSDWLNIYQAMFTAIQELGGAELGDKTILDSFHPAIESMRVSLAASSDLADALTLAGQVAMQSARDTKDMVPLKGRASRLGERAIGHQDAGATSIAIILQSIAREVATL